jgi:hypothetical protein
LVDVTDAGKAREIIPASRATGETKKHWSML